MPKQKVNGINLFYVDEGEGEPLLMIPGHGGSSSLWNLQIYYFSQFYRVIAIDNRGAGQSDKPEAPYSMDMFDRDVHDQLAMLNIINPVNLMAASMGGIIAQAFIHNYPERVKKLILACSGVAAGDSHYTPMEQKILDQIYHPGETPKEKYTTLFKLFYHQDYLDANPNLVELVLSNNPDEQPKHAYEAQLEACMDDRPYYEWLQAIDVPTLIVHSKEDIIWPIENAYTLQKGIGDNARLHIIERAGHILFREKPEEFNLVVDAFLRE